MILEGNTRGYGAELARHLLNPRDNDHVTVHLVDGFVADDLFGAFAEAEAISEGTKCQKYLFSLSLNPPLDESVSVETFEETITQVEKRLGLVGQPRAIVFHEKNGRRHAHAVWSRIDSAEMKAVALPHFKRKLCGLSQELYQTHNWDMPEGFRDAVKRDPTNYSRTEAGQAKRLNRDAETQKRMFQQCWETSDGRAGFEAALKEQGYLLARGDRRGFVAVDADGKVWSLSRWCGVKPREMRRRLGSEDDLPSVDQVQAHLKDLSKPQVQGQDAVFEARRIKLAQQQRTERQALLERQEARRIEELKARQAQLPKGLRGLLSRATGQCKKAVEQIEVQAKAAEARDRAEQQALIDTHLSARRALTMDGQHQGLAQAFQTRTKPDAEQALVVESDDLDLSKAQLLRYPDRILEHISHKEESFTRTDVMRALAKRIDDPLQLQEATRRALLSPELIKLDGSATNATYTTKDYKQAEASLDQHTAQLASRLGYGVSSTHITSAIHRQNAEMRNAFGGALSQEQQSALRHVLSGKQLSSVVGLAGAGKSTLLDTAREAWKCQGVKVHGAALAGKAAEELQKASGLQSRTLASLETSWKNGYEPIAKGDVLVVDEAGMIGTRQMASITAKINQIGAKLVLVGDPDQLQPIEAGTPFRRVVAQHAAARLTEIHRQKSEWQKQVSRTLACGNVAQAVETYAERGAVNRAMQRDDAIESLVAHYAMDVAANGSKSRLAFAHRRKDVHALNLAIRSALRADTPDQPEIMLSTTTGKRAFAVGERIVFSRNDKDIGVKNGMLGTVQSVTANELTVALDGDDKRIVRFDPRAFQNFDHGYAVTIHKSQGATVDRAYVLASRSMDRHLAYVSMTRHREEMQLFVNECDRPKWATPKRNRWQHRPRSRDGPSIC